MAVVRLSAAKAARIRFFIGLLHPNTSGPVHRPLSFGRAAGILLILRAAAPPTPRAYQSALRAAGITGRQRLFQCRFEKHRQPLPVPAPGKARARPIGAW